MLETSRITSARICLTKVSCSIQPHRKRPSPPSHPSLQKLFYVLISFLFTNFEFLLGSLPVVNHSLSSLSDLIPIQIPSFFSLPMSSSLPFLDWFLYFAYFFPSFLPYDIHFVNFSFFSSDFSPALSSPLLGLLFLSSSSSLRPVSRLIRPRGARFSPEADEQSRTEPSKCTIMSF